jgi:hypothetical protein
LPDARQSAQFSLSQDGFAQAAMKKAKQENKQAKEDPK